MTEAIRRHTQIEWIHVRHEEVAAFAAGAEAHLTGSLTVCAGSCGPRNLDLINGLFDCHRSQVPVLIDAVVNRMELAMPPAINLEMAKGFSLHMVKAILNGQADEVIDLT